MAEHDAAAADGRRSGGDWIPLALFLVAFALYAATRRAGTFSDAVMLAQRVELGPTPNYNALYLPLGWLFHRVLQPLLEWDAYRALSWLSVVVGACSVALVWRLLRDVAGGPVARVAWCAIFAFAPGVWFFASSVEVHAVQLACVTVATILCWRAREAKTERAPLLVAAALWIALFGHLTSVLLMPAWVLLALGREPGRGLRFDRRGRRSWVLPLLVSIGLAAAVVVVFRSFGSQHKDPFEMFAFFADYMRQRYELALASPGEVVDYLDHEFVRPAGVLVLAAVLALLQRNDRRLVLAVSVALAPYLFLLPFGGIRENGAYYLSLFPFLVVAAARTVTSRFAGHAAGLLLALAALVQLALGLREVRADGGGEDAREWAAALRAELPPGSLIYTSTLPRWHALSYVQPPFAAVDLWRVFEMTPASTWDGFVALTVQQVQLELEGGGRRVFFDADLFEPAEQAGVERMRSAVEERFPRRVPVPADDPLVLEIVAE